MDKVLGILTIVFAVTALAIVVSKRTQTAKVLDALFTGIVNMQKAAVSPIK